jgi:hypothetical protein
MPRMKRTKGWRTMTAGMRVGPGIAEEWLNNREEQTTLPMEIFKLDGHGLATGHHQIGWFRSKLSPWFCLARESHPWLSWYTEEGGQLILLFLLHARSSGEDELDREAYKPVLLAPIRIELDTDTHRIRDYFTWNVNGKSPSRYHSYFSTQLTSSVSHRAPHHPLRICHGSLSRLEYQRLAICRSHRDDDRGTMRGIRRALEY